MSTQHTPGPWTVTDKRNDAFLRCLLITWGKGNMPIARISQLESAELRPKGESEANARLIAAAPTLLEAARLTEARSHVNPDGSYTVDVSAMDAICAALKKAEGK